MSDGGGGLSPGTALNDDIGISESRGLFHGLSTKPIKDSSPQSPVCLDGKFPSLSAPRCGPLEITRSVALAEGLQATSEADNWRGW